MNGDGAKASARYEQHGDFNYGYRMKCDCGGASYISAVDYQIRTNADALSPCSLCGHTIHIGPAVAAVRNPNDPALDNTQISQFAWYHTSTHSTWPSATSARESAEALLASARRFHRDYGQKYVERQLDQALHVGTYEAAIENMLRRMCDQSNANSEFYLHRVTLAVDPGRINNGYRDENHESAAQLTAADIRGDGLVAVRYLNVHEAIGSLSLAVLPETIVCTQTVGLPVAALTPAHNDSLTSFLEQNEGVLDDLHANAPDTSTVDPIRLRMMHLVGPDPDGIGAASAEHEAKIYALWDTTTSVLVEQYLAGISPVVQEKFEQAMSAWRREQRSPTIRRFADFFAASAMALMRRDAVTEILAKSKPRLQ